MSGGWIDAVASMDAVDAPRFERILQHTLSGLDVTYCPHDVLGVDFPTDEDEALFRLSLLNEGTMEEMRRIEPRPTAARPEQQPLGDCHSSRLGDDPPGPQVLREREAREPPSPAQPGNHGLLSATARAGSGAGDGAEAFAEVLDALLGIRL